MLICLCIIVCQKRSVENVAFTNVSFAATITSIVLAVVSIVFSIISSNGVSGNLSGIANIERNIQEQMVRFGEIGKRMQLALKTSSDQLTKVNEKMGQVNLEIEKLSEWNKPPRATSDKDGKSYSIKNNSINGNLILYSCNKLFEKGLFNTEFDIFSILSDKMEESYLQGYIVALNGSLHNFIAKSDGKKISLKKYDPKDFSGIDSYFGGADFIKRFTNKELQEEVLQYVSEIDAAIDDLKASSQTKVKEEGDKS